VTADARQAAERRVLILTPTGRDAALAHEMLGKAGVPSRVCRDAEELGREAAAGAGAVLAAEEALTARTRRALAELLARQPPWSDLPLLILMRGDVDSPALGADLARLGNASLLERPVRAATLLSAVRSALRARDRQYELRDRFETQALLAAIVSSSDDAIVSKTLDGTILSWNAGAERMFGYSAAEATGRPITLIIPPDRLDEERAILERIRSGERIDHFDTPSASATTAARSTSR
jgi:PAS domain-containing protein